MPAHVPPPPEPICFRGKQAYLIGIGGCGMSGIARLLASHGASVRGSDIAPSEITAALERDGLSVAFDQSSGQLPEGCDLLVASAAVKPDHPQLIEATRRGLPILSYAEALGQCMLVRTGIAVAGTHGKSTTTAMLGAALADAGMEPSVIVGATSGQLARGSLAEPATPIGHRVGSDTVPHGPLAGRPGFLVAESCEFNRSFHHYRPLIASISSVEADHLDVFGSLDEVVRAFHEFAMLIPPAQEGGRLLIAHDGAHRREVTAGLRCSVQTIGFSPQADWVIEADAPARAVTLSHGRERVAAWTMTLPGTHNAINAATALALGTMAGADPAILARSLAAFTGIDRRMQFLGTRPIGPAGHGRGSVRVFDDYGHHPTEIDVTLRALRESERPEDRSARLICVFQPHQHSRTRHLLDEFAAAFSQADVVIVPPIYFVRDSQEEKLKITAADLVDRLRRRGTRAMHLHPFEAIVEQLENLCGDGDVLVVMGAGDVWKVARMFLETDDPHRHPGATTTKSPASPD
ncbi:MAG: UDP-N-acetylmuramate--L-alanine ligase [Phycisphaerae bacterium]|nr:UDP-N-acetylmuramate--L-alanine ligase [Phycisphaerae bacterium]